MRSLLFNSLVVSSILIFECDLAFSQVTPDDTLGDESSVVNSRDATSDSIDGGAIRGQNLFHSFEEFNVGEDRGVYFANPDDVTNIFSRVTGNDVSNILGTLGVDGAANLFLLNPNGIVFGKGASLDVQGSFAATTADGIEFGEQGFFGASNPEAPKLLTINPSAYLFNQVAPGAIANNSQASADFNPETSFDDGFFGLRVPDGQSLLLLGGDINSEGGGLVASGGRIDLGAVTGQGVVGLNKNGSLNIPDSIVKGDVSLTNSAKFLVAGDGGGNIAIAAQNISLYSASGIYAGILSNLGSPEAQAGDITIDATDNLTLTDGSVLENSTFNQGDAGSINIFAGKSVFLDDKNGDNNTFIFNNVYPDAIGNSKGINIITGSLSVNNGAQIQSLTEGKGNSGKIFIDASNTVSFDGTDASNSPSGAYSIVLGGKGNSGGIDVFARSLSITNRAQLNGDTRGVGDAGDINIEVDEDVKLVNSIIISEITEGAGIGKGGNINIKTDSLLLQDGSSLLADTENIGNAGDINIEAREKVILEGSGPAALDPNQIIPSQITATVDSFEGSRGKGGSINISTPFLSVADSGFIRTSTFGLGNAGSVKIQADNVSVDGFTDNITGRGSFIASEVNAVDEIKAEGNGGDVEIIADNLSVTNGAGVSVSTFGQGDAGNLTIRASESVELSGELAETNENFGAPGGLFAQVDIAEGKGGNLTIDTQRLSVSDGSKIQVATFGKGDAGKLTIRASQIDVFDTEERENIFSTGIFAGIQQDPFRSKELPVGNGGQLNIDTDRLSIIGGGRVEASNSGIGKAGDIFITAMDQVEVVGLSSLISANVAPQNSSNPITPELISGDGGNITINTSQLIVRDGAEISVSTFGQGDAGNLSIFANKIQIDGGEDGLMTGFLAQVREEATGKGGSINIGSEQSSVEQLSIINGAGVSVSTFGQGNAGNLSIFANNIKVDGGENSLLTGLFAGVREEATGQGGSINIGSEQSFVEQLSITNGAQISVSSLGEGKAGELGISANSLNLDNDAVISSQSESTFDAGNITLNIADSLQATDSSISTSSDQSSGGNLTIAAGDIRLRGNSDITTNIFSGEGSGGNIAIKADSIIAFDDSDIFASAQEGSGGNINLDTPAFFAENFTLNSLTANPDNLDLNARADVNATGAVSSGTVDIPDVSFIQNGLTELANDSLNTDELVANSCVVPAGDQKEGKFIITGTQSLPVRPGDGIPSKYPTGEVQNVPEQSSWQPGDPIVEPQGAYRLANGKLVLSRECSN
jgi:filamentous hemagglutinin family protein